MELESEKFLEQEYYESITTAHNNPRVQLFPLLAPSLTTRNLTNTRVKQWYTEDEIKGWLRVWGFSDTRYTGPFNKLVKRMKKKKRHFRFSEQDDLFIRKNYKYLSDNTIGLALNVPPHRVYDRRMKLGLYKKSSINTRTVIVIWDKRSMYEEDLLSQQQNKDLLKRKEVK